MKRVVILGSTGSIGRSAIEIISSSPDRFEVVGLAAGANTELLARQLGQFPRARFTTAEEKGSEEVLRASSCAAGQAAGFGQDGIETLLSESRPDLVLNALVGIAGLRPTLRALENGADVALANKESLVTAGEIVIETAEKNGKNIIPVDSEHFSLSRCLDGRGPEVTEIILTASGGPFYDRGLPDLGDVTISEVLDHPTWNMGRRVTVDSAHMLNKGFEVIEAHHLFGFPYDAIKVVIHPQSLVHSLARFRDGSLLAHIGPADMRLPVMNALFYPDIVEFPWEVLELADIASLQFMKVDEERFPAFRIALEAAAVGGTAPAVLNAADELAVQAFLDGKIGFLDVIRWIERALDAHDPVRAETVDAIFEADRWAREFVGGLYREART